MLPNLAKALLSLGPKILFTNNVELVSVVEVQGVDAGGAPVTTVTPTSEWTGLGSLQYERPRIQKAFADEKGGTFEDPVAFVAYLPMAAITAAGGVTSAEGLLVRDVDGVLGAANALYPQSRTPADVGGLGVYFECYLGAPSNG